MSLPVIISSYLDRREKRMIRKLGLVNLQLEQLYGPLYANRVTEAAYFNACMDSKSYITHLTSCNRYCPANCEINHDSAQVLDTLPEVMTLATYLNLAEMYRNTAMIMDWRQFANQTLIPLNMEAEFIIKNNSHLIRHSHTTRGLKENRDESGTYPPEFQGYLEANALKRFVTETWKNSAGVLDDEPQLKPRDLNPQMNGLTAFAKDSESVDSKFLDLVRSDYTELRSIQAQLQNKFNEQSDKTAVLRMFIGMITGQ